MKRLCVKMELSEKIYDYLENALDRDEGVVNEAARYSVLNNGHFWRPTTLIKSAEAYGVSLEDSLPYAVGLEFVHTASLILDDMPSMDDADIRRKKKTCHLVYGEDIAELTSHYLTSLADLIGNEGNVDDSKYRAIVQETKQTALNLIGGQEIDLKDVEINSICEIDRFYGMKTGSLFSAAAAIGGILGGASESDLNNLRRFGMNLGIAYQYGDDLYDELAPAAFLGKPTGKDKNKNTPVKVLGVQGARVVRAGFKTAASTNLAMLEKEAYGLECLIEDVLATHKF